MSHDFPSFSLVFSACNFYPFVCFFSILFSVFLLFLSSTCVIYIQIIILLNVVCNSFSLKKNWNIMSKLVCTYHWSNLSALIYCEALISILLRKYLLRSNENDQFIYSSSITSSSLNNFDILNTRVLLCHPHIHINYPLRITKVNTSLWR